MKHLMSLALTSAALAAPLGAHAADMLGDTLTFTRTYPVQGVPWEIWNPSSRSTTVTADGSDLIVWALSFAPNEPYLGIDPGASSIAVGLLRASAWIHDDSTFDGFAITGFGADITGVTVLSDTSGLTFSISHTAREIHLGLNGMHNANTGFVLGVTVVPEPGTWALWLAGLVAIGAAARRRA